MNHTCHRNSFVPCVTKEKAPHLRRNLRICSVLVRARGLEPPRPCEHYDLNVACLPDSSTRAYTFVTSTILPFLGVLVKFNSFVYFRSSFKQSLRWYSYSNTTLGYLESGNADLMNTLSTVGVMPSGDRSPSGTLVGPWVHTRQAIFISILSLTVHRHQTARQAPHLLIIAIKLYGVDI